MIRKAQLKDLDTIVSIFDTGRSYMRSTGNMNQWINGYPSRQLLTEDIQKCQLFVAEEENHIYGVFAFIIGKDATYARIEGGQWLNENPYGTIHRISSDGTKKGLLKEVVQWAWKQIPNLRADTHADNKTMQNCLEKNGFKYCGIIYVEDGTPRVAYQKVN